MGAKVHNVNASFYDMSLISSKIYTFYTNFIQWYFDSMNNYINAVIVDNMNSFSCIKISVEKVFTVKFVQKNQHCLINQEC